MSATLEAPRSDSKKNSPRRNGADRQSLFSRAGQSAFWRTGAPKSAHIDVAAAESAWSEHLRKRREPLPLADLCDGVNALRWGLPTALDASSGELCDLLDAAGKLKQGRALAKSKQQQVEQAIETWLDESINQDQSVPFAMDALAVAHLLGHSGVTIDNAAWWRAIDRLVAIADRGSQLQSDADLPAPAALAQQLIGGELPLTLAYLFPEIKPLYELRNGARRRLSEGLEQLLNGEGLWHGSLVEVALPLVACWTRCRAMGAKVKKGAWSDDAEDEFRCLATAALQWSAGDGRMLLTRDETEAKWTPEFLQTLLRLGGDSADRAAAREMLGKKLAGDGKVSPRAAQPEPADNCEWAGLAVLRTDWSRKGPMLAVNYSQSELALEFSVAKGPVFAGVWKTRTVVDGETIEPVGDWEEVCWESDDEVDYLELSIDLAGGGSLERQILLAHDEEFLYLADNVSTPDAGRLEHRLELPTAPHLTYATEEATCEAVLGETKPVMRIFPLSLPEWRTDSSAGRMNCVAGALALDARGAGRALCCPLFIDFRGRRLDKQCTWRQLTVGQELEIMPRDVAVGFRAQTGKDQYLFYRSLGPVANRTVLGQNLNSEFFAATFLPPSGEVEELLEIEG